MVVLSDFGFLILFATIAGVLAIRFKQPIVLALLAIGAIVGPNYLGLISDSDTVKTFSNVGAVLLLFTIGIEFNISKLSKLGMRVFLIAIFKLGIVFLLSYWFGTILSAFADFGPLMPLYLGAILSITSTAIVVRVLEQKEMINRKEVPLLVAALIVEDIFAIFALTVFSGMNAGKLVSLNLLFSILIALAILSLVYFILLRILKVIFDWLVKYQAGETMIFTALSLGVGLSFLAEYVQLTPSIGAFLAGSLVASLPKGEELERAISPFALVFSSLFFMSMGMLIDLNSIGAYWQIIVAITIANLLFKFVGMSVSAYLFGFSSKSAVFSGLAMLSIGEFSMLIAKVASESEPSMITLVGITSVLVFISSLATSLLVGRFETIHMVTSAIMPNGLKRRGRAFASNMREITEVFEGGGRLSGAISRAANSIISHLGTISLFLGGLVLSWYLFSEYTVKFFEYEIGAFNIFAAIGGLVILYLVFKLIKYSSIEYNLVRLSLLSRHRHDFTASHIAGDFIKLFLVLGLFIISPFLLSILEVPQYFSRVIVIFIFLVLIWRFLDLIGFEKDKPGGKELIFKGLK
ncbi:MAG: cation:proton antiporter [Candidatus Micrarchaeota archaeon]